MTVSTKSASDANQPGNSGTGQSSPASPATHARWEIQAEGLTKLYGDFPALQHVDLEVPQGEFLALLGRNGAGKTTLLKLLALLTRPTSGKLTIRGITHDGDLTELRRGMGLLGHNSFLYDDLTAEENLLFYAKLYGIGEPRSAIRQMLEATGLSSFGKELVRNFSRGMKQRLAIGRVFLHDPELILLDEPFTGLDDHAVALLENSLLNAHRQGKTILLCTHQLELSLKLASRLLILDRGKVAYQGPNQPDHVEQMRELYLQFAG
ncbi:MAG: ABC transporter ATP-binding protein [Acidobacteria bacterium]|nr:ABC transporter ATP-binding protein [Acidobacteriota bacterium]